MKKYRLLIGTLLVSVTVYIITNKNVKQPEKSETKQTNQKIENTEIIKSTIKIDSLISIKKEIKKEYGGDYMVSFNSDTTILSLLNYKNLFSPLGSNLEQELSFYIKEKNENKIFYKKGSSVIASIFYKNEMYGNTEHYIKGILLDKEINLINNIHIGMSKKDFLQKFFFLNKTELKKIKQVSIVEDERGEQSTKYRFNEGKLKAISFGNYDEYKLLDIKNINIPKWLFKLYPKNLYDNEITQNILVFNRINDSVSSVIIEHTFNVGEKQFLETYKNKIKIDSLNISNNIDADLSMSEYSYKDYRIYQDRYIVTEIIEKAVDSVEQLENNKILDEVETKTDTIINIYQIDNNGKIMNK